MNHRKSEIRRIIGTHLYSQNFHSIQDRPEYNLDILQIHLFIRYAYCVSMCRMRERKKLTLSNRFTEGCVRAVVFLLLLLSFVLISDFE